MTATGETDIKFVADAALGRLARYLRMLGYDAVYVGGRDAAAAAREACREGRVLLTRRRDLATRDDVFLITEDDVRRQLAAAAARFGLGFTAAAMTRCLECNTPLSPVDFEAVAADLPPHVRKTQKNFTRCPSCGRVYWPGTHYARAVARLLDCLRAPKNPDER